MVQDQLPAHEGDVIGGSDVARRRKARGVLKGGIVHAQLPGPLVHPLHKGLLAAGDLFPQRHGAVVGGDHAHRLQHLVHRQLLALLQPDLTAAHGTGVGGGGDDGVVGQLSGVDGLHGQQNGHHLGDAGRLQLLMLPLAEQHRAGLLLHQQRRGGVHIQGTGGGGQQHCGTEKCQYLFHRRSSQAASLLPVYERGWPIHAPGDKFRVANAKRFCYNTFRWQNTA